ncbi:hypothetical protein [Dyadobacter sp. 32]|uniref:hypothetical protein n=1 Tax=Dyadobacter sp. 32 TaxID=538966 RepID=UPI0011EFE74D
MTLSKLHYVNVGKHGTFEGSSTPQSDIDALFEYLGKNNKRKVLIHFHGGLVKETDGEETAQRMIATFEGTDVHVVSFVWETGFGETVIRNLDKISSTALFKKILEIVSRKVGTKLGLNVDGARGMADMGYPEVREELTKTRPLEDYEPVARGRSNQIKESELYIIEDEVFQELEEEINTKSEVAILLETEAPETELFDQQYAIDSTQRGERGPITLAVLKALAAIVVNVIRRYIRKTDHSLYPTIVEEVLRELYLADFGKWMWSGMKAIAEDGMWKSNNGLSGQQQHVGTYFWGKLFEYKQKHPDFKLDLCGHSAGSIAVCNLLKNAFIQDKEIPVRYIFLLAPACRTDLFYDEILTKPTRYEHILMYTMTDEGERMNQLLNRVYTHSLLYLVSGLFEQETDMPILGMQRFLTKSNTYADPVMFEKVSAFFNDENLISPITLDAALDGFRCSSTTHGDFDNDPLTLASLKHITTQNA